VELAVWVSHIAHVRHHFKTTSEQKVHTLLQSYLTNVSTKYYYFDFSFIKGLLVPVSENERIATAP
jgi:hypothetical protein